MALLLRLIWKWQFFMKMCFIVCVGRGSGEGQEKGEDGGTRGRVKPA